MFSKFLRFLGSIRLAVPLLAIITAILIGATILESHVGAPTVQRDIYKSVWFGSLMFLLAMNLGVSTLSRYPWRGARKIGFALTHLGLIVIIAGSAAVIHLNTEGMLLVRTDSGPRDEIRVEGDLLDVMTPDNQHLQADVFVREDGSVYPHQLGDLSLLRYSKNSIQDTRFVDNGTVDNLAVQLSMQSDRMEQTLDYWLSEAPVGFQRRDLGPASLELVEVSDSQALKQSLSPPDLSLGTFGQLNIKQKQRSFPPIDIAGVLGQPQQLKDGVEITVTDVWPDFRLDGSGIPATQSQKFLNPAVQLLVSQGDQQERWYVFANPEFPAIRSDRELDDDLLAIAYQAPAVDNSDFFRVIVAPDQTLYYAANSSKGFTSGPFELGQTIIPGWADFQLTLEQVQTHAQIQRSVVPLDARAGDPALLIETPDAQQHWLAWGAPTTLNSESGDYFAAFSPKVLKLPFEVQLNDFIVERNEGSESVAMWTSDINLRDETGLSDRRRVWMNHPTWFKGWKLAQASWNPGDLSQSTLQLKREPWWVTALTWLGSLLVVIGVGTMFYGRSITKRLPTLTTPEEDADSDQETVTTAPA